MESKRFEESFRNAFDGAEVAPSENVWTNVELDLEKASAGKIKRNLIMFQLLAAATTAFALGIGALYYLDTQPVKSIEHIVKTEGQKANQTGSITEELPKTEEITKQNSARTNLAVSNNHGKVKRSANRTYRVGEVDDTEQVIQSNLIAKEQSTYSLDGKRVSKAELTSFLKTNRPALVLPKAEEPVMPDPEMLLLAQLKDIEKQYQQEDKKTKNSEERIWTSVGFGAGSYKPKASSGIASLNAGDTRLAGQDISGASYSASVNVGGKISNRLVVQGGISYLTQNADFTSTAAFNGNASLNEFIKMDNFKNFQTTTPYTVNSNLKFISIPVQAGYLILDRTFAIQVNGGIATDLFISNTLTPDNKDFEKVTQAAGSESPYRTVNFSGLLGTELSYRIANHYRISLNPGLRYSINSIYKSDVAAEIAPVTYDVSLRFRYIFK